MFIVSTWVLVYFDCVWAWYSRIFPFRIIYIFWTTWNILVRHVWELSSFMVSLLFNIFSSCPFTYQTDFKCMCLSVRYHIPKWWLYFVERCIYHSCNFYVHGSRVCCYCCLWCLSHSVTCHSIGIAEFVLIFLCLSVYVIHFLRRSFF